MAVYKRPDTDVYWMSYTDENGKRWRMTTGTNDPPLAESVYQKTIAEVALKKANQLASSVKETTAAKLDKLTTAMSHDPSEDPEFDWPAHSLALEKAVADLQEQFDKLFVMMLTMETGQKKFASVLIAAAAQHLGTDSSG